MDEAPEEILSAIPPLAYRKRKCLIFLLAWAVVTGVVYAFIPADWETPVVLIDMVAIVFVLIFWIHLDAAEHNFRLWRHIGILLVICPGPFVVLPIYFIRSRGWADGLIACGKTLAFVLLQQGLEFATTFLVVTLTWE